MELGPRALAFTNPGDAPLEWRAVADSPWIEVTPRAGMLAPGATAWVAISVAHGTLPAGSHTGNVAIRTDDGDWLVPVTMLISPSNTAISAYRAPLAPINRAGCAEPTTHTLSATIAGAAPPAQALVYYTLNGGAARTQPLAANGGEYSATIGPFSEPGTVSYALVITEADGNVVRSTTYILEIEDCPEGTRRIDSTSASPTATPATSPAPPSKPGTATRAAPRPSPSPTKP